MISRKIAFTVLAVQGPGDHCYVLSIAGLGVVGAERFIGLHGRLIDLLASGLFSLKGRVSER